MGVSLWYLLLECWLLRYGVSLEMVMDISNFEARYINGSASERWSAPTDRSKRPPEFDLDGFELDKARGRWCKFFSQIDKTSSAINFSCPFFSLTELAVEPR